MEVSLLDFSVEGYNQTRTMNPIIARAGTDASELQPAPQSMPGMRHGTRSGLNYHPSELLSLPSPQPHTYFKHRHTYIHTNSDGEMNPLSRDSERYIRPLTPYHYVEEESEDSIQSYADMQGTCTSTPRVSPTVGMTAHAPPNKLNYLEEC